MKKNLYLLTALCLSFPTILMAQDYTFYDIFKTSWHYKSGGLEEGEGYYARKT